MSGDQLDEFEEGLFEPFEFLRTYNRIFLGYFFETNAISEALADFLNIYGWLKVSLLDAQF